MDRKRTVVEDDPVQVASLHWSFFALGLFGLGVGYRGLVSSYVYLLGTLFLRVTVMEHFHGTETAGTVIKWHIHGNKSILIRWCMRQ